MAEDFEVGGPLPEESTNRTFIIAAAGLGGLLILSMICLGVYALVIAPRQRDARILQATQIILTNTAVARELTEVAQAARATVTPSPSNTPAATATSAATATQVVVLPTSTNTPFTTLQTVVPMTETAAAQQTLEAAQQASLTPTATALPTTGFGDEAGVPGLMNMGAALIALVFIARQLRTRTAG